MSNERYLCDYFSQFDVLSSQPIPSPNEFTFCPDWIKDARKNLHLNNSISLDKQWDWIGIVASSGQIAGGDETP